MVIVDANVLIYAVNEDAHSHEEARAWLDGALAGGEAVGLAWNVLLAFLRLVTARAVFEKPLDLATATGVVEAWLFQPASVIVAPTPRHLAVLRGLLHDLGPGGNLVNDAHLAALALEHGADVVSYDSDFARFSGVRWRRPG